MISIVKLNFGHGESWDLETGMQGKFPELLMTTCMNFVVEILLRRRECDDWKIGLYFLKIPSYFD